MDLTEYNAFINYLTQHDYPPNYTTQQKQKLARQAIQYTCENGILFKKNKRNPEQPLRIITLQDRDKLLYNLHSSPLSGHFAVKKTIERAIEKYYWPTMGNDIKSYVESCDVCQRMGKPARSTSITPIKVTGPFEQIGIDFVGPLKVSSKQNRYIIVATDYLTKWPEAKPIPKATALEAANFLYEHIICKHGVPSKIISDHGTAFIGNVINALKMETGFRHNLAAVYHPQTNGLTERFNGTLCNALKKCVNSSTAEWDDLIPSVLFAYRTMKQSTTKFSPFYLMHGREAQLPIDLELFGSHGNCESFEDALDRRISDLVGVFTDSLILAKDNIGNAQQLQKERINKLDKAQSYKVGDLVLLYDAAKQNVHGDKFTLRWKGPYVVKKVLGPKTCVLADKDDPDKMMTPTNIELMRHYKQN
jgi:Integrase zinc binding domain/Integrase core domain